MNVRALIEFSRWYRDHPPMFKMHHRSLGWDENHWAYRCSDGDHASFWKTVVSSPAWAAWREEVYRRMSEEDYRGAFDIDECQECNWISAAHFEAFLDFTVQSRKVSP